MPSSSTKDSDLSFPLHCATRSRRNFMLADGHEKHTSKSTRVCIQTVDELGNERLHTVGEVCQTHSHRHQKETMKAHSMTSQPWEKVCADLMECKGKTFLVIVDHYSGFFQANQLRLTTSAALIRKIKANLARHGRPSADVSDNGPPVSSNEVVKITREWGFEHVTSSPDHTQSNCKAESTMKKTAKILQQAMMDGSDPYTALHKNSMSALCSH